MTEEQLQSKRWIDREYGCLPPIRSTVPREPNARDDRIRSVIEWLASSYYGATKYQIAEHFPDYYGVPRKRTAGERQFYRDLKVIMASGKFVNLAGKIIRADRAKAMIDS